MKHLIIFLFIYFIKISSISAQDIEKNILMEKIVSQIKLDNKTLKDSVALYTFNIKLQISGKGKEARVQKMMVSDSLAYGVLTNLDVLYTNDYSTLTKGKPTEIIIPFAVIVSNHPGRSGEPKISVINLGSKIENLFSSKGDLGFDHVIYFDPVIIFTDTNIYD